MYSFFLSSNHFPTVNCLRQELEAGVQSRPTTFLQDLSAGSPAHELALLLQQGLV